ncbi:MAG: hypothetical protein GC185_07680 [Alphaproteobacteria bacterium]|nr:hypothetical protein [Alphaproteobacteria bacterium]
MKFIVFILGIWAISWFHRREHRRYVAELKALQAKLAVLPHDAASVTAALEGTDWRMTALEPSRAGFKRAFQVKDREDLLRYAVPVALLVVIIVFLHGWGTAGLYGAALALKWFAAQTELTLSTLDPRYEVTLFGLRLFGEDLS